MVTWDRDEEDIEDDEYHSSSQIVTDPVNIIYYNILRVTGRSEGTYSCHVYYDTDVFTSKIIEVEGMTITFVFKKFIFLLMYVCSWYSCNQFSSGTK